MTGLSISERLGYALVAWIRVRSEILLTYWIAEPIEPVIVAAMASTLPLWWSISDDIDLLGKSIQVVVIAFLTARVIRGQYHRARRHLLTQFSHNQQGDSP